MKKNDIATVYVAYTDKIGGKRRPVLIVDDNVNGINFFRITSKYQDKSEAIRQFYFPIQDWKEAGLNKKSWIDIGVKKFIPKTRNKLIYKKIGTLSINDRYNLNNFLENNQNNKKELSIEQEILKEIKNDTYTNLYQATENIYTSDEIISKKFSKDISVEHFYSNHKNEIKKCISELSLSVGISEKEILGEDYKRNSCIIAYKVGLNSILKKIENGTIDPINKHKISSQKNDLEME